MNEIFLTFSGPGPEVNLEGHTIWLSIQKNFWGCYDATLFYPTRDDKCRVAFDLDDHGKEVAAVLFKEFSPAPSVQNIDFAPGFCLLYDFHTNEVCKDFADIKTSDSHAVHGVFGISRENLVAFLYSVLHAVRSAGFNGNLVLQANGLIRIVDRKEHVDSFVFEL